MVRIKPGTFLMGDGNDLEQVYVRGYWIDRYPHPNVAGKLPSTGMNWYEADHLCREQGKRLCSGIEWERACKGPEEFAFSYADQPLDLACHVDAYLDFPQPCGEYPDCVSGYGTYDMVGNVNEWTSSFTTYEELESIGWRCHVGESSYFRDDFENIFMIQRGADPGYGAEDARCGRRDHWHPPWTRLDDDGFRCCRDDP